MPYKDLGSLPRYVRGLSQKDQERWLSIYLETFQASGNESDALSAANVAFSLSAMLEKPARTKWAEMRALAEASKLYPTVECFLSDVFPDWEPSGVYSVQVMRTGLWKDHPSYGDILITKDDLVEAIKNYRNAARKPFLDDDHGITNPSMSAHPGEAFGWMRDMWIESLSGNRLEPVEASASNDKVLVIRAEYEINQEANEWLKTKKKALYSPTIAPVYYNKESGELQGMTVLGGAMTNMPYFDGMDGFVAVAASERVTKSATRILEWSEPIEDTKEEEKVPEPQPVPAEVKASMMVLKPELVNR